jgi:hypothetical protein
MGLFRRILLTIGAALWLTACANASLLTVTVAPTTIAPHAHSPNSVTRIDYTLARPATISVVIVDAQGNECVMRENLARAAGSYEILFSGAYNGRVLPNGSYTIIVRAKDDAGNVAESQSALTIVDADTQVPELQNFSVAPAEFTPNQDGIDDRVTIRYFLEKPARVDVYLTDGKNKYPVAEKKTTLVLTDDGLLSPGSHEYDYDGGIDLGAPPPPDGTYTVVAQAEDAVGNQFRAEKPLTIKNGGVPRATIIGADAEFKPLIVPLGGFLTFTVTVKNVGPVPIRTKGPEPGTVYTTSENFNTKKEYEEPGIWRIGVDYEGNSIGRQYPYRWQIGRASELQAVEYQGETIYYLMPGKAVTISGQIQIIDKPPLVNPHYWIGLVQESVRIVEDRVGYMQITVEF